MQKITKTCHLGTIAQLCRAESLQLRHVSTIGKKLVKQQYLLHMSAQYGELRPTNGWDLLTTWQVWGTPANFNGFRILAALLHDTLVVGVVQTLRHWTEGTTYVQQGGHHVGHWPTFCLNTGYNTRSWHWLSLISVFSIFKWLWLFFTWVTFPFIMPLVLYRLNDILCFAYRIVGFQDIWVIYFVLG